jgi:hypothetical protein
MLTFIKDGNNKWTVVLDRPYTFDGDHGNYAELVEAVRNGDEDKFLSLIDVGGSIIAWSDESFKLEDGVLSYEDMEVPSIVTRRVLEMQAAGEPYQPVLRFLERLYNNPSRRSVHELFTFLEHKNLPITSDGYLMAYKYVAVYCGSPIKGKNYTISDGDFVDGWTRKSFRYNVGDVAEMPRNQVDDNCNNGCGAGLHFGALEFVQGHSNAVIVKIDPADVVSIPVDCGCQKARCCKYEIVALLPPDMHQRYEPVMDGADFDEDYEDDEYDEYDDNFDNNFDDDFDYDDEDDDEDDPTPGAGVMETDAKLFGFGVPGYSSIPAESVILDEPGK